MNYHPDLPQTGYVSRDWVKRHYGISNSTLHAWQNKENVFFPKSVKIGPRAVRFRVEDIREFDAKLTSGAAEAR